MNACTASALGGFAAAVSAAIAIFTFLFTFKNVLQSKETQELTSFDRIFSGIAELEARLYSAMDDGKEGSIFPKWRGMFLNRLEYLSFLINHGYLKDQKLSSFFSDAVVNWYEEIFDKLADVSERVNPKIYPELRLLYSKLKQSDSNPS